MIDQLKNISLQCPQCSGLLQESGGALRCSSCGRDFPRVGDGYSFVDTAEASVAPSEKSFEIRLRNFYKRWPRLYYFVATMFGPALFTGESAESFLKKYAAAGSIVLNLGSGPKILRPDVVNVDMFAYHGVDIVADICALPIKAGSVDCVVCDEVVEHVESLDDLLAEIQRILKPGGAVYFTVPFLYPFHSSPVDFSRWTKSGFQQKLKKFDIIESGVRAGPFSAVSAFCCYAFALILSFNNERMFWLLMNVSIFIFFPIKIFDIFVYRLKFADHVASVLYHVARKRMA